MNTEAQHADMVFRLAKDGGEILADLTPYECGLWHMLTGIAGEVGELIDPIKKAVIYRKPLDRENVIEELGDLEFYLEGLRQSLGISRDETLKHNMAKLGQRYESGSYSNQAAIARADKAA